jgi:glycosidase
MNVKTMPKLRFKNAIEWIKCIFVRWREVDGYRIDVASGIKPMYLRSIRKFIK